MPRVSDQVRWELRHRSPTRPMVFALEHRMEIFPSPGYSPRESSVWGGRPDLPILPWTPTTVPHSRKFIYDPISGLTVFAEWEGPVTEYTKGVYLKLWPAGLQSYEDLHNTDPWVWTRPARYTECLQGLHPETQDFIPGDILLFGGPQTEYTPRGTAPGGWLVDTVFHVGTVAPYTMDDPPITDVWYRKMVIEPLRANELPGKPRTMYTAKHCSIFGTWGATQFPLPCLDGYVPQNEVTPLGYTEHLRDMVSVPSRGIGEVDYNEVAVGA